MDGIDAIHQRVSSLRNLYSRRDEAAHKTRAVRAGDWQVIAAGAFTEDYPGPMVANTIDEMARDFAASLTPLPSISCTPHSSSKDSARKFAEKRTKIANHYVSCSNLQASMTDAADSYNCFGMVAFFIDADLEEKEPKVQSVDGSRVYATWDSQGRTVRAAERFMMNTQVLADMFPESVILRGHIDSHHSDQVEAIRYCDRTQYVFYVPEFENYVISSHATLVPGRSQYVCVPRPSGNAQSFSPPPRGAYDDLIYAQISLHEFRQLTLEAAAQAVQAPIAVPLDVSEVPLGPNSVIPTQDPQGVRRIGLDVPGAAFAAASEIKQDIREGGMSPMANTAQAAQASIITGKGVEALGAGYSNQIANAQVMIGYALEQCIEACFMMDEHLWPNLRKTIEGKDNGTPYRETYKPSKDINGEYRVAVEYGFLSGMAPNNALVFVLQAHAGGLVSADYARRQLPTGINPDEEERKIQIETIRQTLGQALAGLGQAIPAAALQGQDPQGIISGLARVVKEIQSGKVLEDVIVDVFAPAPPPAQQAPAAAPGPPAGSGAGGNAAAGGGGGALSGLVPGAAQLGPNNRPDLQQLFAGMSSSGNPVLQGGVSVMQPVQGQ